MAETVCIRCKLSFFLFLGLLEVLKVRRTQPTSSRPGALPPPEQRGALRHLPEPPQERLHRSRQDGPPHGMLHLRQEAQEAQ